MNNFLGSDISHQNPYGIAQLQPNGVHMMPMQQGQMMNRFVYQSQRNQSPDEQEDGRYPSKY
jgi:ATF/CREB family transcription factor